MIGTVAGTIHREHLGDGRKNMTLDYILSLFKNKRDESIIFTVKYGPVVHYNKMSARQIAESPKFGAVSGDEVIDFVVPKGNGEKVDIIELQEPF